MLKLRPPWPLDAERELWADICAPKGKDTHPDALWWFIHIAWGAEWYMRDPGHQRWLVPRIHRPYLRWLQQQLLDWKEARRSGNPPERWYVAIILSRGFGKTVTATKCAMLWSHLDEPNMSSVIGSETHPKAKEFLKPIKEVISGKNEYSWFAWLYGKWDDDEQQWNAKSVTHAYRTNTGLTEPSIDTTGAETGITGLHPDQYWEDDPLSATKLREGGSWLDVVRESHDAVYPALATDGWFAMVLTRYLDNDIAGKELMESKILSWDGQPSPDERLMENVGKGVWRVYFLKSRLPDGQPTLPEVASKKYLDDYERRNPRDFAAQMENNPGTGEHMPLAKEQIPSLFITPEQMRDIPIEYATIHLDTAFRGDDQNEDGDFNVIAVALHDLRANGLVYFDGAWVNKDARVEEFNDQMILTIRDLQRRRIRIRAITDETEPGGKRRASMILMQKTIEGAGLRCPEIIQLPRQGTRKVERIKAAAGFWTEGWMRLVCPKIPDMPLHVEWKEWHPELRPGLKQLINEMLRIGVTGHDDVSDACADIFIDQIWKKPYATGFIAQDEGANPVSPGDTDLKGFGKRMSNTEAASLAQEWSAFYGEDDPLEGVMMPDRY
jgi:hypothetical protein